MFIHKPMLHDFGIKNARVLDLNPLLSTLFFSKIFLFSTMFFSSYISPFLPQKTKFVNFPFLKILETWTFMTILLQNLKFLKPFTFVYIF